MPRSLKLYIAGLVVVGAVALAATSLVFGVDSRIAIQVDDSASASALEVALGIGFWVVVTLFASALPVRMPGGLLVAVAIAPCLAAMSLGGPAVGAWVALLGTTEIRELRGKIPWYGTLANHAGIVLPAVAGGIVMELAGRGSTSPVQDFSATLLGGSVYFFLNLILVSAVVALRAGLDIRTVAMSDARSLAANTLALAPLAWLMSRMFLLPAAGWWATLLFALPLYTTRVAYHRFVEMREMFTQTIGALAEAVDKRDPFTSQHSRRVKQIAVDIGREMRVSESELEALEWGGLLHDVGKIGVPDAVLLKQDRLNREERMIMNAHPVLGAEIIAPVTKLAPELPIIRHHHEWYNGSGYPDRLIGDEIPKLARILHVADAFEAMTAARPYRMTPLTSEQALAELRKFAGVQFDPAVVDAFVRTGWVDGVSDPGGVIEPRPIPLIAQAANRMAQSKASDPGVTRTDPA
ncbi:MAG TPA: HD-GYP domain-containing protein [Sphingomicrobium sp.]|jgi:putative nucleotidyltransferase with HDIG domain|nr:HD-GYP domain-containing protein [Sphingomicrobium sp.]